MSRLNFLWVLPAFITLILVGLYNTALAHSDENGDHAHAAVIPAAIESQHVKIYTKDEYRYIESNGLPDHATGRFPNRSNPNSIRAQKHYYRVPIAPNVVFEPRSKDGVIGVALNGIPFEPSTGECWSETGQRQPPGSNKNCRWREEAIIGSSTRRLGLDYSNAHVQPNGTYHYHGIPWGMIKAMSQNSYDLVHVGYAADGVRIFVSKSGAYKPSYKLKLGTREGGPGGRYDGKYTADYEYAAAKMGDLDQCNGAYVGGEYVYFITAGFPYAPRCLMGIADESFSRKMRSPMSGNNNQGRRSSPGMNGRSQHRRPY